MRPIISLSFALLLTCAASGQSRLFTFSGDSPYDQFGSSVGAAGDVNGDGFADVIVGAPFDDNNGTQSGSARVVSGRDGSVLFLFSGDAAHTYFGWSVSGAGDINKDGYDDVVVGGWGESTVAYLAGIARVFSGFDGSVLWTFKGTTRLGRLGGSVAAAGDVNRDGYPDIIVGAWRDSTTGLEAGSARVFSGADGTQLHAFFGAGPSEWFGYSVDGAGDVDGDGFSDLIVGAPGDSRGLIPGSADVYSGRTGALLFRRYGQDAFDKFGHAVSGAGDVNGDGTPDVIVGAYGDDNAGTASGSISVLSGRGGSLIFMRLGDQLRDYFGYSVSGAGDVDHDGYDDVVVGAWGHQYNGPQSGYVRVLSGFDGGTLQTIPGVIAFGNSVRGVGDVNRDGFNDILVGTPVGHGPRDPGFAKVYSGRHGVILSAPATPPINSRLDYTIATDPARPGIPYFFDVSLAGNDRGFILGTRRLPLTPPLLNLTFGASLPGSFLDFIGTLDAMGEAGRALAIPDVGTLRGVVVYGAALTFDATVPGNFGISNGVRTTIQ